MQGGAFALVAGQPQPRLKGEGAPEGSVCAVRTTAKPLATRRWGVKRVRGTAVPCTTIERPGPQANPSPRRLREGPSSAWGGSSPALRSVSLPPHACVAGPAQREAAVGKMGNLPATGSFVHSGNSHQKAPSPWGGSSRRRRVRVGPQRGKALPTGSCRRSVTFLRSFHERSSRILKATEGSACPVSTTAKPLATRSRQPKRVQSTVSALHED